ncbi:putative beta-amylase [Rosa chinensis]|uniref:Beta-amylase n=1 Tax=Rosa chinensis TaxID=74649 RepID=A0A2P6RUZ5_ROSCH|nr:beta-amylase 3, chloroplastic-like [Rosa chinensis]PRQ50255.1 putative beta-amylase [Rosa chinensis]
MIAFTNRFKNFFGVVIQDVQISLGPDGELKFPSGQDDSMCGEFQCYDNYMCASLQQFASDRGVPEWGSSIPDEKEFLSNAGWKTEHGRFFLEWYSGILVSHVECILRQAQ